MSGDILLDATDELRKEIKRRGGAYGDLKDPLGDGNFFFAPMGEHLLSCLEFASKKICPGHNIKLRWMKDNRLNAFAYTAPDTPDSFIGINIGALYTLHDLFMRMMCDGDFLPTIGNSALETVESAGIRFLTTNLPSELEKFPAVLPKCEIRACYASYAFSVCMDFLLFHEVTHIANGHSRVIHELSGDRHISENATPIQSEKHFLRQSLEKDADCGAIGWVFERMEFAAAHLKPVLKRIKDSPVSNPKFKNPKLLAMKNALESPAEMVKLASFVTYAFFRIFNWRDWDVFDRFKLSHPEPPIRQAILFSNIASRALRARENGVAISDDDIFQMQAVEECVARLLKLKVDPSGIVSVYKNSLYLEHLKKLDAAWSEIRPRLEALKLHDRPLEV